MQVTAWVGAAVGVGLFVTVLGATIATVALDCTPDCTAILLTHLIVLHRVILDSIMHPAVVTYVYSVMVPVPPVVIHCPHGQRNALNFTMSVPCWLDYVSSTGLEAGQGR